MASVVPLFKKVGHVRGGAVVVATLAHAIYIIDTVFKFADRPAESALF